MKKAIDRTLWVEVVDKHVYLRESAKVPDSHSYSVSLFGSNYVVSREEFERWSGLKLAVGIHGIEVQLAVVKKVRVVTTKDFVAAERTHTKYEVEEVE